MDAPDRERTGPRDALPERLVKAVVRAAVRERHEEAAAAWVGRRTRMPRRRGEARGRCRRGR